MTKDRFYKFKCKISTIKMLTLKTLLNYASNPKYLLFHIFLKKSIKNLKMPKIYFLLAV